MTIWKYLKVHWVSILTYLSVALLVWIAVGMPFYNH